MPGLPGGGIPTAPPGMPAPQDTPGNVQPVEYKTGGLTDPDKLADAQQNSAGDSQQQNQNNIQQTALRSVATL